MISYVGMGFRYLVIQFQNYIAKQLNTDTVYFPPLSLSILPMTDYTTNVTQLQM